MLKNQEINGKAVRDENKRLLTSLLTGENEFARIRIHAGGIETGNDATFTLTHYNLKQTEQDYLIAYFRKHSRFSWDLIETHHEGDNVHFGKVIDLVKLP
jgi:hypothetical protein